MRKLQLSVLQKQVLLGKATSFGVHPTAGLVSLVVAHEYVIIGPVAKNILEMYFIGLEQCFSTGVPRHTSVL
jgi:hypothetical protein